MGFYLHVYKGKGILPLQVPTLGSRLMQQLASKCVVSTSEEFDKATWGLVGPQVCCI
jgi:hypothetical protein